MEEEVILSVIVPIKNEINYINELLSEMSNISNNDIEIIISDNYSDDGSWEVLKKQTKSQIKIFRPPKSCTPFENHTHALSQATGKYVYPIGGDDIFLIKILNNVLPILKKHKNIIVVGRVEIFKDVTNEVIKVTNHPNVIESFFEKNIFSIKKYLSYINYDNMFFSFVPRNKQGFMKKLHPISYETFAVWSNFYNFYGKSLDDVYFVDDIILRKRYFKQHASGNFSNDQEGREVRINIKKFKGTVKNSFQFMRVIFDLKVLIYFSVL